MIYILCKDTHPVYQDALAHLPQEYRHQIQFVTHKSEIALAFPFLSIENKEITLPIQWFNHCPPVFLGQKIPFDTQDFCALICALLADFEQAEQYLQNNNQLFEIIKICYAFSANISLDTHTFGTDFFAKIYKILASHYGLFSTEDTNLGTAYTTLLDTLSDTECLAFITKHYVTLLHDAQEYDKAILQLFKALEKSLSEEARIALTNEWYAIELAFSNEHTPIKTLKATQHKIAECIRYYETKNLKIPQAFALIDAALIAQIEKNYAESLAHLNKADALFKTCGDKDLSYMVHLQKGKLLLHWAQTGQVQFYREALKEFQTALQGYNRNDAPDIYAEIQHQLGIIYAEIPDEMSKRALWTGLSLGAFKEALSFFDIDHFPYEYASICNHQGNAYTKYPKTENSDHYLKALQWYDKALAVRNATQFPQERALCLLNYLEALDSINHTEAKQNHEKYLNMEQKAYEVLNLTQDTSLTTLAKEYLEKVNIFKQ